jgi:hypothetical protein
MKHAYPLRPSWVRLVRSLALAASIVGLATSCSSSNTGGQQPNEGGSGEANGMSTPESDGGMDADAMARDAASADAGDSDAMMICPSFANFQVACSRTCNGNCYGTNDAGYSDPSNHIGDCFFTATGNIIIYCARWGISDPCSHCLR